MDVGATAGTNRLRRLTEEWEEKVSNSDTELLQVNCIPEKSGLPGKQSEKRSSYTRASERFHTGELS